jgi:hypothetical protein
MLCPSKNKGRRECRVPNAPAASRAKMKKHDELVTTGSPDQARHSPHNGFNGLFRALLGVPGLLATVVPGLKVRELDASVGASSSLRADAPDATTSTASRTNVCDDRETPLVRDGMSEF